jgi:hypothetical protein
MLVANPLCWFCHDAAQLCEIFSNISDDDDEESDDLDDDDDEWDD